ncbi:MAG: Inositol 2-dehydrogenase [Verrucomicrobiota bacterium]|jgi:predicted dehydrogenase
MNSPRDPTTRSARPEWSRRGFLGAILAAGAAPLFIPSRLLGAEAPSKLLRIGCIGTGRMGHANMKTAIGAGAKTRSRVVAVCDVDRNRLLNAKRVAEGLNREMHADEAGEVSAHSDYRELLAREDIDGVILSTPDFAHTFIALEAVRAGKGLYVEKPLTFTIPEGQALVRAVRERGVVLQTGSMQRSMTHFHRVCWLVRNGRIGAIQRIEVTLPRDRGAGKGNPMPVPETLDYAGWMGPTPDAPYIEARVHPQGAGVALGRPGWMQIERYCRGMVCNWGAHMYDIAQWGLGVDFDSGPVEVSARGEFPDRGLYDVHTQFTGEARYANGVVMSSTTATGETSRVRFIGTDGWMSAERGNFAASNRDLLKERPKGGTPLATSNNHLANFLDCLRSGATPVAPVEVGHRSNTVCVLHHLSMKLGRTIRWDPITEQIQGDADAAQRLHGAYRPGYALPAGTPTAALG